MLCSMQCTRLFVMDQSIPRQVPNRTADRGERTRFRLWEECELYRPKKVTTMRSPCLVCAS